jgi:hypothetical protein
VLLSYTDRHDQGRHYETDMPLPDLVAYFLRLRAEVGDFIPAASPEPVPDDPSGVDAIQSVSADEDGRLWGHLDPEDEVLSYDSPEVQAIAERDPALAEFIAEERANPWLGRRFRPPQIDAEPRRHTRWCDDMARYR